MQPFSGMGWQIRSYYGTISLTSCLSSWKATMLSSKPCTRQRPGHKSAQYLRLQGEKRLEQHIALLPREQKSVPVLSSAMLMALFVLVCQDRSSWCLPAQLHQVLSSLSETVCSSIYNFESLCIHLLLQLDYEQAAGECRLYIPIEPLVQEATALLTDKLGGKVVMITGSPGMGKSMLAIHLACTALLEGRAFKRSEVAHKAETGPGSGRSLAVRQPSLISLLLGLFTLEALSLCWFREQALQIFHFLVLITILADSLPSLLVFKLYNKASLFMTLSTLDCILMSPVLTFLKHACMPKMMLAWEVYSHRSPFKMVFCGSTSATSWTRRACCFWRGCMTLRRTLIPTLQTHSCQHKTSPKKI